MTMILNAFTLGRMRHLDLLALWCYLNPGHQELNARYLGALSKDGLAALVLASP